MEDLPMIFGKIFCKQRNDISEKIDLYHPRELFSLIIHSLKHLIKQKQTKNSEN